MWKPAPRSDPFIDPCSVSRGPHQAMWVQIPAYKEPTTCFHNRPIKHLKHLEFFRISFGQTALCSGFLVFQLPFLCFHFLGIEAFMLVGPSGHCRSVTIIRIIRIISDHFQRPCPRNNSGTNVIFSFEPVSFETTGYYHGSNHGLRYNQNGKGAIFQHK